MGRRSVRVVLAISLVALVSSLGASAMAEDSISEGQGTGTEPMTVAQAFPEGLPEGAVQIDDSTVSFDGGAMVLYLAGIDFSECVSGQLCFWANSNFGGQSVVINGCCTWHDFGDYGFNNEMSSWRNHRPYDSAWAYGAGGAGVVRCMDGPSSLSYVGDTDNDAASSARQKSSTGGC